MLRIIFVILLSRFSLLYLKLFFRIMNKTFCIILFLVVISFWRCKTSEIPISSKDVSTIYNPISALLHPEYIIYHNTDTTSLLFFKIRTFELLYRAEEVTGKNRANLSIFYKIYPSLDSKEIIDSATTVLTLNKSPNNYLVSYIPIHLDFGKNYSIEILTSDNYRNTTNQQIIEINKKDISTNQFFLFTNKNTNQPLFKSFINDTLHFKINNSLAGNKKIVIKKYISEFEPALPPFSSQFEKFELSEPKEQFIVENKKDIDFTIANEGLYAFSVEEDDSLHTVINFFNPQYPEFKTPEQLLEGLIYLNASKEFKTLKQFENPKFAVDSFWLNTTGNVERAKELIRIYYNRAQLANYYFTTYKEGWKTDRGMIYLILGMPTTIFKTSTSETWTYGKSASYKAMEFNFEKEYHSFSNEHFVLRRSEIYDRLWYQAVDTWRNGRAFSIMN